MSGASGFGPMYHSGCLMVQRCSRRVSINPSRCSMQARRFSTLANLLSTRANPAFICVRTMSDIRPLKSIGAPMASQSCSLVIAVFLSILVLESTGSSIRWTHRVSAQCTIGAVDVYTECVNSLLAIAILCTPILAESLDGVWRSQGYGYVYEIHGPALKSFEVTGTTCVPGFTADRDITSAPGREATFTSKEGDVLFIRTGASKDHKLLHND